MTQPDFSYELTEQPPRLTLHGELDEAACVEMRTLIDDASAGLTRDLAVVLSDVEFMPSEAVGVVAKARATAARNGATLTLVAADGSVAQRVLSICGLTHEPGVPDGS